MQQSGAGDMHPLVMDLLLDLKLEEDAERVEVAVAEAAASFSPEAQYRGALRWLRRLSREAEAARQPSEAKAAAEDGAGRAPFDRGAAQTTRRQANVQWRLPNRVPSFEEIAAPPSAWEDTSRKMWERTYALIEAHPHLPYEQMAIALYGEASQKAKSNVRSQCAQLKKEGLARAVEDGLWEVIPREAAAESSDEGDTGESGEAD